VKEAAKKEISAQAKWSNARNAKELASYLMTAPLKKARLVRNAKATAINSARREAKRPAVAAVGQAGYPANHHDAKRAAKATSDYKTPCVVLVFIR